MSPSGANALVHEWNCTRASGDRCTDPINVFHSWVEVDVVTQYTNYNDCAKAITQAGNQRSGDPYCASYTFFYVRCLSGPEPLSRAYVHWGGSGGAQSISGTARTPSDSGACW